MTILHTAETARLGELLAVGRGLLLRYRDLRDGMPGPLRTAVDDTIDARSPLLDQVEEAIRQRGQLPPAADKEPNELHALLDGLGGALLGDELLTARIVDAEAAWAGLLDAGMDHAWDADEQELMTALRRDSAAALERLRRSG